jgi:hypothetical protein
MNADIEADSAAFVVATQAATSNKRGMVYENQNKREGRRLYN